MKIDAIEYAINAMACEFGERSIHVKHARMQLEALNNERIALGKALGWLMEESEVYVGSGDPEFTEAWLNAEDVMLNGEK